MQWLEISADTDANSVSGLCDKLEALGITGLVIEDEDDLKRFLEESREYWDYVDEELLRSFSGVHRVKFYLEDSKAGRDRIDGLEAALGMVLSWKSIKDEDWATNWKKYYHPIEIGEKILILPEWESVDNSGRVIVKLDPGLIFGTGSHPTTRLCLEALEQHIHGGEKVLDAGCGSGILGITSILLGAATVTGCDIDEMAPKIARENAALNGIGSDVFRILHGNIIEDESLRADIGKPKYDIVLANIVADVILALSPLAADWLSPDGVFICSGIIEGRERDVVRKLEADGFTILREMCVSEWFGYICTKR